MTHFLAVVRYATDADQATRIRELKDGLAEVGYRLVAEGLDSSEIEDAYETAMDEVTNNSF